MPSVLDKPSTYLLSTNEKQFILKALQTENRIDGRQANDFRKLQIQISLEGNAATVRLGQTLVEATVSASIEQPVPERPSEGRITLRVESSPMAAPGLDSSIRAADDSAELQQMLDKAIRDIRAVDLEALCIAAGRKVWRILLDVKVLDAAGNTIDTVFIATLAALMAFKRPEASVEVSEDGLKSAVTLHSTAEREAIPLSLHQAPLAVTFAVFLSGEAVLIDPHMKEEAAAEGLVTVVLNAHNDICLLQKTGGLGLTFAQVMRLVRTASVKRAQLGDALKAALEAHEAARVAARVRRREAPKKAAAPASRSVATLPSGNIQELETQLGVSLKALEDAAAAASSSEDEDISQEPKEDADMRHSPGEDGMDTANDGKAFQKIGAPGHAGSNPGNEEKHQARAGGASLPTSSGKTQLEGHFAKLTSGGVDGQPVGKRPRDS